MIQGRLLRSPGHLKMAKRASRLAKKAKKKGLSLAKASNIRKAKMAKRGILTEAQAKKRKEERKARRQEKNAEIWANKKRANRRKELYASEKEIYPLTREVSGEEMMDMMDPEDLDYLVKTEGKKRKHEATEDGQRGDSIESIEDEERSFDKDSYMKNMRKLLPVKTDKGIISRYTDMEEVTEEGEVMEEDKTEHETKLKVKSTVDFLVERQQKLEEKKIKIGCLAANFLVEPEERLSGLSSLVNFMDESDPDVAVTVKKYAALSLLEVFHSIIPSYYIVTHDMERKLKKVTKKMYFYENQMLSAYQLYLKGLEDMLKSEKRREKMKTGGKNPAIKHMVMVALKCFGSLLTQHSHFNFTSNIIRAFVPYLNHVDDEICSLVTSYLAQLFKADKDGRISLEVVQQIDRYVRGLSFRVRPEVLKVLLVLRVKEAQSIDVDIEANLTAKRKLTHTEKLLKKLAEKNRPKKSIKEAKIFRKKRKLEEKMKGIHKEKETKIRKTHHTSVIQLVFGLFIHVLKRRTNNKLMGVILEGLAKFAHLINIEFFADLLNVLGELMAEDTLKFRESLHCIQVVFTILSGQGEVLTLDPHRFYKYLYANMFELSAGTNHNDVLSALESVKQMLVERHKRVSLVRVQAFSKRIASLSLTLLHSGTIASLAVLRSILLVHPSTETLLETDSEGTSGVFSPEIEDPEHCNASASSLWELHYLMRHYHSTVRQMSEHVVRGAPLQGDYTLPYTLTKRSIEDLFEDYDPSEMRFNPAIPTPSQHLSNRLSQKTRKHMNRLNNERWITDYMTQETRALASCSTNNPGTTTGCRAEVSSLENLAPVAELNDADFYSGMLLNMNLDEIPTRKISDDEVCEDFTISLLKSETRKK